MSNQSNYQLFVQNFDNLSDEEIRRRLIEDHQIQCGPVTPQTKRILLKKLIKLEHEKSNSFSNNNDNSFNNNNLSILNTTTNNVDEQQQQQHNLHHHSITNGSRNDDDDNDFNNKNTTNGSMSDGGGSGGDEIFPEFHHQIITTTTVPSTELLPPQPSRQNIKRQSPRKSVTRSKIIDDEKEAIKSFKVVEKTLKQQQTSRTAPVSLKNEPKIINTSTSNIRLDEFSSESSGDEETLPELINAPKTSTIHSTPKIISGITMPRVSNDSTTIYKSSGLTRAPIRRTKLIDVSSDRINKKSSTSSLLNYSDSSGSDSETEFTKKDKICQMLLNHRPGLGGRIQQQQQLKQKSSFNIWTRLSNFFQNFKQKLFRTNMLKQQTTTTSMGRENFSTSTNYISYALLSFVIIFFIIIFSIYIYSKFTYTSSKYYNSLDLNDYAFIQDKSKLLAPICKPEDSINGKDLNNCLQNELDRKPALNLIKEIKNFIDKRLYEDYCGPTPKWPIPDIKDYKFKRTDFENDIKSRILPMYTASDSEENERLSKFKSELQLFDYDLSNAFKLIRLNSAWNLQVEDVFNNEISLMPNYSINLPIQCNLKLFWRTNFWIIISTGFTIFSTIIMFFYYSYSKNKERKEQELVYDLIEKSMELLQSPDEPQSMPVLHIRDSLLSPAERKSTKFKRIWNKVVEHIESSESRVKVEYKKIDGEEFKAWKWIATTNNSPYVTDSENEVEYSCGTSGIGSGCSSGGGSGSQTQNIGGVEWQGQAFAFSNQQNKSNMMSTNDESTNEHSMQSDFSSARSKNFQALTRFLKIRNIFEKETQFSDRNWNQKIVNTILDKIVSDNGQHDIVHIEIDDTTPEGLVFLKCSTLSGATQAFHALHGWWCEKKLVSVKFLKEERYYHRYPHAKNMNTPLKQK